jgi:hypothetical protein
MDPKRPHSEISHLFLSDIRSRTPGGARPQRIAPPKKVDASIDMTPEEFEASLEVNPETDELPETSEPIEGGAPSVTVVLSSHLAEQGSQSVRQYARNLAVDGTRVGLIEADNGEFAISCFEANGGPAVSPTILETLDIRQMSETLNEMAIDIDRWLISLPNAKSAESREVLRGAPHWVLLTTADHEGVVATYRTLKGLAELGRRRISLVVLDARDDAHADAVFRKLDAVSRQFLHSGLEAGSPLRPVQSVTEHLVLACQQDQEQAASGKSGHWQVIGQFLSIAEAPQTKPQNEAAPQMKLNIPQMNAPEMNNSEMNIPEAPRMSSMLDAMPEVIDLPENAGERSILDAVVRQGGAEGRWVLCPIHPPMCPEALLAVGRDQRLMLLAIAGRGLGQLLSIGRALQWMSENTDLIRMALPQLSIDATAIPCVKLLVDHNDLSAEILQPMLQTGTIQVQAYRRVKWGGKTGLLLEAA